MTKQEFKEFIEWAFKHYNDSAYNSMGRPVLVLDSRNPYVVWTPYNMDPEESTYHAYSYEFYKWVKERKKQEQQEQQEQQDQQ